MFYLKRNLDDLELKTVIYGDNIYTDCLKCGKEIQVDEDLLRQVLINGDLCGTSLYCQECSERSKAKGGSNVIPLPKTEAP
jgi:hypothetical protein